MLEFSGTIDPQDFGIAAIVVAIVGITIISGVVIDILILFRLRRKPIDSIDLADRLRSKPWTLADGLKIFSALILLYGLFLIVTLTSSLLPLSNSKQNELFFVIFQTTVWQVVSVILVAFFLRKRWASWGLAFGIRRDRLTKDIYYGIAFFLASMPVVLFFAFVYDWLLSYFGYIIEPQDVVRIFIGSDYPPWARIYLGFLAIITAPLVEELIFRGLALPTLLKRYKFLPAAYLVSIFFAFMHFHIPSLVPLFIIAVSFSLGYLYSGSIIVPMVMHSMFNSFGLLIMLLIRDTSLIQF